MLITIARSLDRCANIYISSDESANEREEEEAGEAALKQKKKIKQTFLVGFIARISKL